MAKFRYYIACAFEGRVFGTDDPETAKQFAATGDAYVIDSEDGTELMNEMDQYPIEDIAPTEEDPPA